MVLDPTLVTGVVFASAVMGAFARTMFPYLRKAKEQEELGEPVRFERKYIYTSVFAAVASLITGMTLFPELLAQAGDVVTEAALPGIFFSGFLAAWGMNSVINNVIATSVPTSDAQALAKAQAEAQEKQT